MGNVIVNVMETDAVFWWATIFCRGGGGNLKVKVKWGGGGRGFKVEGRGGWKGGFKVEHTTKTTKNGKKKEGKKKSEILGGPAEGPSCGGGSPGEGREDTHQKS